MQLNELEIKHFKDPIFYNRYQNYLFELILFNLFWKSQP